MFVAHDIAADEWVCQIPIFPLDSSKPLDRFDELKITSLIRAGIYGGSSGKNSGQHASTEIIVKSIKHWHMTSVVAEQYSVAFKGEIDSSMLVPYIEPSYARMNSRNCADKSLDSKFNLSRFFLCGDAAHAFPPAGGFGMNTGLQDAHNLAWKLAAVLNGDASDSLLDTYDAGIFFL